MIHVVAVVCMCDSLKPELDRCQHSHVEGEEISSEGQDVAESMQEEEECADHLCRDSSTNKLCDYDLCASMGQSTMTEEKVSQSIQVFHLNVSSSKHIRLLVILDQTDRDIGLFNCHLICLLRNYGDHVAKLALNSELTNGFDDVLAL